MEILDQRKLPLEDVYVKITCVEDGFKAIKDMQVRGAPCIAIVGLLSLAVELSNIGEDQKNLFQDVECLYRYLQTACERLCQSRPTAVNMRNECDKLIDCVKLWSREKSSQEIINKVLEHIEKLPELDVNENKALGHAGADYILKNHLTSLQLSKKAIILTHCNTGSLATAGYGTALGVIRALHERNSLEMAYCTETRPYNQGSRLTSYELFKENIPSTLICDNMAGALMSRHQVTAVVVGADRVTWNGDTANKIGTYSLAVLANYHKVPFFIALPVETYDPTKKSGEEIVIEDRPHEELRVFGGKYICPKNMNCWNPSFDVTPSNLITGYITKYGVLKASELPVKLINQTGN